MPSSSSSSTPSTASNVVFSKVVRSASNQNPALFLPQLAEYLQTKFQLPSNLPMIYESVKGTENDNIVSWYSPLSPSMDETRLMVQIVAIHTTQKQKNDDDDDDETMESSFPTMAMVAVQKDAITTKSGASVMNNLFADSEKKILKALDRGLDQFSDGKIVGLTTNYATTISASSSSSLSSSNSNNSWVSISRQDAQHDEYDFSQKSDVLASTNEASTATNPGNELIQSTHDPSLTSWVDEGFLTFEDEGFRDQLDESSRKTGDEDVFGGTAAKVEKRNVGGGDFAVEAARKIVENSNHGEKVQSDQREGRTVHKDQKLDNNNVGPSSNNRTVQSRILTDSERQFSGPRWTISTPKNRLNTKKLIKDQVENSSMESDDIHQVHEFNDASRVVGLSSHVLDAEIVDETQRSSTAIDTGRRLNMKLVEEMDTALSSDPPTIADRQQCQEKEDDPEEVRKGKEAQRIMTEIAESGQDMTAEELLRDVLKFGEEKKIEEEVGSGFVSGAFEKAKELLREQQQMRESRKFKEISNSVNEAFNLGISSPDDLASSPVKELSPEEELRRIFHAGERLAESRIELTAPNGRQLTEQQDQQVDDLLAEDETVSSYARTLDEELAELEIRINRNPDEDMDAPMRNPKFDIMSGPEVYNPNVDPESAVNWPGALPGRKKVRLPKELDEAVKQAKFAANVIMKMREEQVVDPMTSEVTVNYYVSDRLLLHSEVLNLQTVVAEAVKLGILRDPVEYMAEGSRLAIIIDELRHQPDERFREIAENYKDLLLSDNFVDLLKERLTQMADRDREMSLDLDMFNTTTRDDLEQRNQRERYILGQLVEYAQLLLKETRALGAALEAQQIEVIRSICKVAMDPSYVTEEETAQALTDAVRDMRPLFDDTFVAYIKYAVAEEEGRLARAGVLDDPDESQWLMVLKIVQQGVYSEIAKGINRYIEHIWYILRMKTRQQRRNLLSEIIDAMPTLDVRPFVKVVDNIASSLGNAAKGESDPMVLGDMTNSILQLHRDVHDLLPPDRINDIAKDADEWAAKQRQRLLEQRNLTRKRLQQARETEPISEAILRRAAGEIEQFE